MSAPAKKSQGFLRKPALAVLFAGTAALNSCTIYTSPAARVYHPAPAEPLPPPPPRAYPEPEAYPDEDYPETYEPQPPRRAPRDVLSGYDGEREALRLRTETRKIKCETDYQKAEARPTANIRALEARFNACELGADAGFKNADASLKEKYAGTHRFTARDVYNDRAQAARLTESARQQSCDATYYTGRARRHANIPALESAREGCYVNAEVQYVETMNRLNRPGSRLPF